MSRYSCKKVGLVPSYVDYWISYGMHMIFNKKVQMQQSSLDTET